MSLPAPFKPTGEPLTAGLDAPQPDRRRRIAIVLLDQGAPDGPEAVRSFLFNRLHDPALLPLPNPLRFLLAHFTARRQARTYGPVERASPTLANAEAQAKALEEALWDEGEVRAFVSMRYWQPRSDEAALAVKDWNPDELVLLPLRPQFSAAVTGSFLRDWRRAAQAAGLDKPTRCICCYPTEPGFVRGAANLTRWALAAATAHGAPRILFAAQGLPERLAGPNDPYVWQCERTAEAIVEALAVPGLDWRLCYQPDEGLLKSLRPSVAAEVERAGRDKAPLVVVPISTVSSQAETPADLDRAYRDLARHSGVPHFVAVPTVMIDADFIEGLANLVRDLRAAALPADICSRPGGRICPVERKSCPNRAS